MSSTLESAVVRISILDLVVESYTEVFQHLSAVVRVSVVPILLGMTFSYASSIFRFLQPAEHFPMYGLIYILSRAVTTACIVLIAVRWHRLILLGESISMIRPSWSARYRRFWLWSVLLMAGTELPLVTLAEIMSHCVAYFSLGFATFLILALACFEARLALVLPAVAVEHDITLARIWNLSAQNGIRLAVSSAVVLIPALLILGLFVALLPDGLVLDDFDALNSGIGIVVGWLLVPFVTCLEVGVLSHAYRKLTSASV